MDFTYWLAGFVAGAGIKEAPTKEQWQNIIAEMNRQKFMHEYKPPVLGAPTGAAPSPFPGVTYTIG